MYHSLALSSIAKMRSPTVRIGKGSPATPLELETLLTQNQGSWSTAAALLVGGLSMSMVPTWKTYRMALQSVLEGAGWEASVSFVDSLRGGQLSTHALFKALLHLSTTCTGSEPAASMRVLEESLRRGVSVGFGGYVAVCKRLADTGSHADLLNLPLVMARHQVPVGPEVTDVVMEVCATKRGAAWVHAASLFGYSGPGGGSMRTVLLLRSLQGGQWAAGVGAFMLSSHIVRRQPETLAAVAHLLQRGGKWQVAFSIASQLALVGGVTPEIDIMLDAQSLSLPWKLALAVAQARSTRTPESLASSVNQIPPEAWDTALQLAASIGSESDVEPLANVVPSVPPAALGSILRSSSRGGWKTALQVLLKAVDRPTAVMAAYQLEDVFPCTQPLVAESAARLGVISEFVASTSVNSALEGLVGCGRWEEGVQHVCRHLEGPCPPLEGILADRGLWAEAVRYCALIGGNSSRTVAAPLCIVHRKWDVLKQLLADVPSLSSVEESMMRHASTSILSEELLRLVGCGQVKDAVAVASSSTESPSPLAWEAMCVAGVMHGLIPDLLLLVARFGGGPGRGTQAVKLLQRWSTAPAGTPVETLDDVLAHYVLQRNVPPYESTLPLQPSPLWGCPLIFPPMMNDPKAHILLSPLIQWADSEKTLPNEWWLGCAQVTEQPEQLGLLPWSVGSILLRRAALHLSPPSILHLIASIPAAQWATSVSMLHINEVRSEVVRRSVRDYLCQQGHWLPALQLAEEFAGRGAHDKQLYIYALQASRGELLTSQAGSWVQAARMLRKVTAGPQARILRREILSTAPSAAWMAACHVLQDAVTDKDPTVTYGDVEKVLRFCAQRGCTVAATQIIDWYMRVAGGRVSDKQFTLLIEATLAAPHSLTAAQNAFVISTMRRVAKASSQHRLVDSLVSLLQGEAPVCVADINDDTQDEAPVWTDERKRVVATFYPLLKQAYPPWVNPDEVPCSELFAHIASEGLGGQVTAADVRAFWFAHDTNNQKELAKLHTVTLGTKKEVPPSLVSEVLHKVKYGTPNQIRAVRDTYFPTMTLPDMKASLFSKWKESREYRSKSPSTRDTDIPVTDELIVRLSDYGSCDLTSTEVWRHICVVLFNGCTSVQSVGNLLRACSEQVTALARERWPQDAEQELADSIDKVGSPPRSLASLPTASAKEIDSYYKRFKTVLEGGSSFSPLDLASVALSRSPTLITTHSSRSLARLIATQRVRLEDMRHSSGKYTVEDEDTCQLTIESDVQPRYVRDDRSFDFAGRSLRRQKKILGYVPSESVAQFMMAHGDEDYGKTISFLKELGCSLLVQPVRREQGTPSFDYMQHQPLMRSLFCTARKSGSSFSEAIRREFIRLLESPLTVDEGRSLWREIVSNGDDAYMSSEDIAIVRSAVARS